MSNFLYRYEQMDGLLSDHERELKERDKLIKSLRRKLSQKGYDKEDPEHAKEVKSLEDNLMGLQGKVASLEKQLQRAKEKNVKLEEEKESLVRQSEKQTQIIKNLEIGASRNQDNSAHSHPQPTPLDQGQISKAVQTSPPTTVAKHTAKRPRAGSESDSDVVVLGVTFKKNHQKERHVPKKFKASDENEGLSYEEAVEELGYFKTQFYELRQKLRKSNSAKQFQQAKAESLRDMNDKQLRILEEQDAKLKSLRALSINLVEHMRLVQAELDGWDFYEELKKHFLPLAASVMDMKAELLDDASDEDENDQEILDNEDAEWVQFPLEDNEDDEVDEMVLELSEDSGV